MRVKTLKTKMVNQGSKLAKANSNWERYYSSLKRMPKRMREAAQFVVDTLPDFKNHGVEMVLDLGCGAGRHSVLLANSGFEVVGIDISKNALKMARKWVLEEKLGNVALVLATMTNLPLINRCSDAVISVSVMHHAFKRDIATTVNEVYRTLRKNGWFLANLASVTDPRFGTGEMVEDNTFCIPEAFEEKSLEELHHFFTKPELSRLLHNFHKKKIASIKEKPNYEKVLAITNYWKVLAVK
jgi:ubiquinone/menaquinone biosynthesis C-methylase UbiE